jgi:hypothetical protein
MVAATREGRRGPMDLSNPEDVERAAEFTYIQQGIPALGDMSTMEAYKLGFVAGMRLAGEEFLKMAQHLQGVHKERTDPPSP